MSTCIRKAVLAAAIGFFSVPCSSLWAQEKQTTESYTLLPESHVQYLDENLPSLAPGAPQSLNTNRGPLMALLDQAGVARSLDDARINIKGWVEGSYTYNFDNPAKGLNLGRVFDINDNRPQINQIDLQLERKADLHQWDLGGKIEFMYGTDARFTTANGFFGNSANSGNSSGSIGGEYQPDMPQLYVDLTAPIGNGLRFRFGKFLFFKQIDPNASVFFSHSFTFGGALPFTLTGITAYYPITDALDIEGGISRGWGQALRDNNGAIDGLGRVRYKLSDTMDASLALICGPEQTHDNSHYRTVLDATLSWQANDKLTFLFDGVYGDEARAAGVGDAQWYGVSAYGVYKCCDMANFNVRGEVYRDEAGYTTGVSQTLFEVTAGMTITPFYASTLGSNFKIRPEVRYDYSTRGYFNGLADHGQFTVAVDAYYDF